MSVPAFTTIPNRIWRKCHEDTRFARRLRQVFNQIEAIFPSRYRDRERDGDISGGFGLRRQTIFGGGSQLHQKETARLLLESACSPAPDDRDLLHN